MSIELVVRNRSEIPAGSLRAAIGQIVSAAGGRGIGKTEFVDISGNLIADNYVIEPGAWSMSIRFDGATIDLYGQNILGDPTVTVTTGPRDPHHLAKLVFVAIALAQLESTGVLDDAGWLGTPGEIDSNVLLQRISTVLKNDGTASSVPDDFADALRAATA